ncbi:AAA family ATPase [Trichocoleus sp. DQ-U1]
MAQYLIGGGYGFSELVQFHPAYTYEDFIQGIRPQSQDGQLKYSLVPGRFLEFCKKAESCQGLCVLIIDEINRANLAQVFGELMYLLEYRDKEIPLAGGNTFRIPLNVRIIGTMNTADRSIALVDHALRRRFAFIELRPNYEVLRRYHEKKTSFNVDKLIDVLKRLNNAIADKHYEIGISFFLTEKLPEDIESIWLMEIEPYLEEYFFDNLKKVDEFRWDKLKQELSL